jgi:hypothetical protein
MFTPDYWGRQYKKEDSLFNPQFRTLTAIIMLSSKKMSEVGRTATIRKQIPAFAGMTGYRDF